MLQQIRDKITGWFASLFLGAIAVVFIFWGIRFESGPRAAAAKVNGETISVEVVRRAWQDRLSQLQQAARNELPEAVIKTEQQKLLEEFVNREVLQQHVQAMGYRVSDADIAQEIQAIPALQVDGKFSRDRYAALLRQQGESEAQFEQQFRRDLQIGQLRNGIGISAFTTVGELRRRVALEGETREVDWYTVAAAPYASQVAVTPAEVQAYYDQHKATYVTPETVSLQYVELKAADVASTVSVTDEALRQYYDQVAPERYVDPERRRARHILVETGKDDAAARKRADELYARAKAGEDFARLASENSDDAGSKAQGGELGWATKESYVPAFADALFSMQKGEIRGPVKTEFGYHIIELEDVQPAHQRGFDEVRADLEKDYRNEQAQSLFYEKSQQLADDAFASLSELESVAKKQGLQLMTVEGFTRKGGGPFGDNKKVIDAVFSDEVLQERQNSPAIDVANDEVVVLRVTDYKPSVQRPLEEVRPEIEAALREQGARKAAEAAAKASADRITGATPFADVAAAAGAVPVAPAKVDRTAEGVPPELLKAIFAAPRPAPGKSTGGTAVLANGDVAVFVVNAVHAGVAPTGDTAAIELSQVARKGQNSAAIAEFRAYVKELERTAKVKLNENVFSNDEGQ
ncbi:MAG TPA: SurA N-terminal domain-containing protein [Steroidobacteraceae bacterium]|nr:SurA N-terminal domain-containing protein [Steroidobacteraceae bacterium]